MKCNHVRVKTRQNMYFATLELTDSYELRLIQIQSLFEKAKITGTATIENPDKALATAANFTWAAVKKSFGFTSYTGASQSTKEFGRIIEGKIEDQTVKMWTCQIESGVLLDIDDDNASVSLRSHGATVEIYFPNSLQAKRFYRKLNSIAKGKSPFIW